MKTRTQIIAELKRYFNVKELVCNHVFAKHGGKSWMFLSTPYLETLLFLRQDLLKVPMVCNTNTLKQRGLRCNLCQIVKDKSAINVSYLSAHVTGSGGDFSSSQMSAEQMRQLIKEHAVLLSQLTEAGFTPHTTTLTPQQIAIIVRFWGMPSLVSEMIKKNSYLAVPKMKKKI